jgi:hypothetical protein
MGRVWVLDTETKGTGAEMVPLERVQKRSSPERERLTVIRRKPKRRGEEPGRQVAPEPRQPLKFKVVDLMTRRTLAEGVEARKAVKLLERARSVVDLRVYVWEPQVEEWRPLTLGEQTTLRKLRGLERGPAEPAVRE